MKNIKAMLAGAVFAMVAQLFAAAPTVTAVTAKQRYPWNGKVDIAVTFTGASNDVAQMECSFVATNTTTQAVLPVATISGTEGFSGSGTTWVRRFVWDAAADIGAVKIDDVALTVEVQMPLGGVQLWKNGPYWAECNVGASKPEEYGYYFWWGDTVGYKREGGTWDETGYSYSGVTWVSSRGMRMSSSPFGGSTCPTQGKDDSTLESLGYIDSLGLAAAHDAATAHLGAPWRMPTHWEFCDLLLNCDTTWMMKNGVYGRLVTGKGTHASKSIFLPAAGCGGMFNLFNPGQTGYYWSTLPGSYDSDYEDDFAFYLCFYSSYIGRQDDNRILGQSIRPLRDFVNSGSVMTSSSMTMHLSFDLVAISCIPDLGDKPTDAQVSEAMSDSADTQLVKYVTNGVEYVAYRTWATNVQQMAGGLAGTQMVRDSPYTWLSYALDSAVLVTNAPVQGEMKIAAFEKNPTSGKFDFLITVNGITVGANATPSKLATLFSIEGCGTVDGEYLASNVSFEFGTPSEGKVLISANPNDEDVTQFFIKAKMKP